MVNSYCVRPVAGLDGCKGNRMIRRLNRFSNRHPLLSILAGFVALILLTLLVVPADPDYVDAAVAYGRAT